MKNDLEFKEKRKALIEALLKKGIKDKSVIDSMQRIPRELFVNTSFLKSAYKDTALPIDCGQTISQPYTVAFMTQLLDVKPGDKILEIGTGSGYQATLLFMMGAEVYSIERHEGLHLKSQQLFDKYGIGVNVYLGDGSIGLLKEAPFDGIIVTAAAPDIIDNLKNQLKVGGNLVIPVGGESGQEMMLITRTSEMNFVKEEKGKFKFVPLIGSKGFSQ